MVSSENKGDKLIYIGWDMLFYCLAGGIMCSVWE